MAKDRDNLAADFDTESTTGFLAEEEALDRRMLWRLGSWGVAAVGAVIVAVLANQSALTLKRDQLAASDIARQAQQLQTLAKESHNETRRLASAIDTLNGDRDRLYSRITSLEQGLDSVTGTIAKQATAPSSSAAAAPTQPVPANSAPAVPAPVPAVAPVATTSPDKAALTDKAAASTETKPAAPVEKPVAAAEKPAVADKKPAPATKPQAAAEKPPTAENTQPPSSQPGSGAAATIASPMTAAAATSPEDAKAAAPVPLATPVADKQLVASREPASNKATEAGKPPTVNDVTAAPMPPLVITPDPDSDVDDDASAPKAQIQRTEFGVDLGTANSVNGLRALWRGLLKSKANAPLAALRPIIVIKENSNGLGMQLRLVAGPLNDAGTAAKICAGLSLIQRTCETAIYDGQRLALNEPPAGSKPVPAHRRMAPKRAAAPPPQPVAEDKKPEPTTISSMFRRNSQ
ncbi:hypothetical protein HAP48_0038355 [Bradyrhizobium septentrionale]|uniref:SPOR domain-containing protein n=1 Tax=Bradyrhizobium septentrionale TaxID=1404411 RepID=A0A974A259_9BRAD|nr:hypothetical protein [Bradyrhizobium septentrionale]UGY14366.1 hypothetical protein HAP48_0038355 [Bradyrhizobium septentrionale]UGY22926.1 hypothetical protein HU675_0033875 [Bradyrhizobium septentrionale]